MTATVVVYRCPVCRQDLKITTGYPDNPNQYVCNDGHPGRLMRKISTGTDCGDYFLKIIPAL